MNQWYALYTKPKMEQQVHSLLEQRGMHTYLPLIHVPKRGTPKLRVEQPFFPCYLFAQIDFSAISRSLVNWMPGMRGVISFCGEPTVVDERIIETLRSQENYRQKGDGRFQHGDLVRIKSGVMQDMEAIFDEALSASGRVRILLNILSRQTACEIQAEYLERVVR
ncbi:MAG: transcription termination/antitermination NusG family protein [Chloroflexota bacterium]|nr:transcription termination/antitermination NusG family protein [Chloroflexota bacterium]